MKRISSKIKLLTPGSWLNSCCKVFLSFSLLVFSFSLLVGQTRKIDSLKQVVRNSSLPDTVKLEALDELTRSYMHINPDSGRKLAEQVIELGTRINNKYWIARGANEIGIYCEDQGNIADALVNYDRSMKLFQEVGDKKGMCSELTNMGNLCEVQGNYTGALIYYNRVLKLSEEVGNKYSMADAYGNIGLVNEDMGDYPEALKNFNHSIARVYQPGGYWRGVPGPK
jgi:tetratricopeptide (TPR) repeat protein